MNAKTRSCRTEYSVENALKVKTVSLRLAVTDQCLEAKIKEAFDLAKSGGRELDLTFSPGDTWGSSLRRLHST
jgi:hypothetical protein